jgi:hypothetical protein
MPSMDPPQRNDEQADDDKGDGGADDEAVGEFGVVNPETEKGKFGLPEDQVGEGHDQVFDRCPHQLEGGERDQ